MWDDKTPGAITRARILRMPAPRVYDELKDYGAYVYGHDWFCFDDDLEQALYDRSDELINLGLAQFGASRKVTSALYKQSLAATADVGYNRAIQIAVLGNCGLARACELTDGPVGGAELLRLASTAENDWPDALDALRTLLQNPGARAVVSQVFNRQPPFDQVQLERFSWLVAAASQNPSINECHDSYDGPDLTAYNLQKGIWKLVQTLPVSECSIESLSMLLDEVDPRRTYSSDADPTPAISRWRDVKLSDEFKKRWADYRYTTLDYAEEFCCLAAALYGRWYERSNEKSAAMNVGAADSPKLFLRCAYYAHATLTVEQMQRAHDKDKDAFTLAALCNPQLVCNPKTRAVFEGSTMLANSALWDLYNRRRKELLGVEPSMDQDEPPPTAEQATLARIETAFTSLAATLGARLTAEAAKAWWVLGLLFVILIVVWSGHS